MAHKLRVTLALVIFFQFVWAQSPISLSATHFPGSGDTLRYSVAQLSSVGNYTQTGTNFNWNFGGLIPLSQGVRSYKPAFLTNYAFFFSLQDFGELIADQLPIGPLVIQDYYNFYRKQTNPINAYIVDGAGMTFSSIPVPSYYTDKDELYKLPMTYPQYDSTTFRFSTPSTTLLPIVYSKTGYRITQVDGWGTITTPFGTASCLRVVSTQYSRDSIKTAFIPLAINNYQRSYQWLTTTSKIPFLEVNGNVVGNNFTPTQVRYRDKFLNITGIKDIYEDGSFVRIFPNPVLSEIHFPVSAKCDILIHDVSGKIMYSNRVDVADESYRVSVEPWPAGLYHVTLSLPDKITSLKFIKQ
jgi:hypothetical protein